MNGAEVGRLKQAHQVSFGRFLQGHERRGLEAQVGAHVLGNLAHEALEGQAPNQNLGGLLVAANLAEGDGSGLVAVGAGGHVSRGRALGPLQEVLGHFSRRGLGTDHLQNLCHNSEHVARIFSEFERGVEAAIQWLELQGACGAVHGAEEAGGASAEARVEARAGAIAGGVSCSL